MHRQYRSRGAGGGRRWLRGDEMEQEGKLPWKTRDVCCFEGKRNWNLAETNASLSLFFFFPFFFSFSKILISARHKLPHTGNPEW